MAPPDAPTVLALPHARTMVLLHSQVAALSHARRMPLVLLFPSALTALLATQWQFWVGAGSPAAGDAAAPRQGETPAELSRAADHDRRAVRSPCRDRGSARHASRRGAGRSAGSPAVTAGTAKRSRRRQWRRASDVTIQSTTPARTESIVRDIRDAGGKAIGFEADITDVLAQDRLAAAAAAAFDGLDVPVSNAGDDRRLRRRRTPTVEHWRRRRDRLVATSARLLRQPIATPAVHRPRLQRRGLC